MKNLIDLCRIHSFVLFILKIINIVLITLIPRCNKKSKSLGSTITSAEGKGEEGSSEATSVEKEDMSAGPIEKENMNGGPIEKENELIEKKKFLESLLVTAKEAPAYNLEVAFSL